VKRLGDSPHFPRNCDGIPFSSGAVAIDPRVEAFDLCQLREKFPGLLDERVERLLCVKFFPAKCGCLSSRPN